MIRWRGDARAGGSWEVRGRDSREVLAGGSREVLAGEGIDAEICHHQRAALLTIKSNKTNYSHQA